MKKEGGGGGGNEEKKKKKKKEEKKREKSLDVPLKVSAPAPTLTKANWKSFHH